ncbi:carbohydrate-binding domain-containing protein [Vagococcus sp. BWB3-3]|uniref:Carbohydrate-binding domain-containing protein n=1 Tax=Vagococcus allomyrinae TaxID=2794353 RepID=A0A940P8L2_9ENTE|nr:carbohydrate-binding domain-containing protein [Vagococcus allomyrinae]MBP1043342.1 carbohydrate-binding domain-containing protein [Vagococcus allomyrinae]
MSYQKSKKLLLLATLLTLSACQKVTETESTGGSSTATTATSDQTVTETEAADQYGVYSDKDKQEATVADATTTITLTGQSATVEGEGVTVKDGSLTITQAGTYAVSGELKEGQLKVAANKETDDVRIILNGATISNSTTAPIEIETADKVIITLAKGTTNVLTDNRKVKGDSDDTEPDAALFSKADLTLNGQGSLEVVSRYHDGIRSKDDLVLISGTYQIEAANNGLKGNDSISILAGNYEIKADNDGIQSSNSTDETKGWLAIDGGSFNVTTGRDGIQAETNLKISNGTITIEAGSGSTGTPSDTESLKGMKAGSGIQINTGKFTINSADDSLHANGSITIENGEFNLKTGDDGIHADDTLTINNGQVTVAESYEGLEAADIIIEDGTISVTSSDDGLNAGGGSDGADAGAGGFGKDNFGGGGGDYSITINGGVIFIDAEGDGIDSNGTVTQTGGTALVSGPTNGGNGALDYDGTYTISGGILVAAGSGGMAMLPSDSSSQASVGIYFDSSQGADQLINVADSDGNNIISFAPNKSYQHVAISAPDIQKGSEYTLSVGGTMTTDSQFGFAANSDYQGDKLLSLTIEEMTTSISQSGEAVSGNQMGGGGGGRGGGGGQPPR